jgi:hypothetical protein
MSVSALIEAVEAEGFRGCVVIVATFGDVRVADVLGRVAVGLGQPGFGYAGGGAGPVIGNIRPSIP